MSIKHLLQSAVFVARHWREVREIASDVRECPYCHGAVWCDHHEADLFMLVETGERKIDDLDGRIAHFEFSGGDE